MGDISEHLSRSEVRCHCGNCNLDGADFVTVVLFEKIRKWLGDRAITITNWNRCPAHNARVGGSKNSYHLRSRAFDMYHPVYTPGEILVILEKRIPNDFGIGTYPDKKFNHIDSGPFRRWRG